MTHRIPSALAGLLLLSVPVSAGDCPICDPEIVITPALAACFLERSKAVLDEMVQQNLPYQLVNLGSCDGVVSETRGGAAIADSSRQIVSWQQIRNARPETPTEPTTTFILDRSGVICLDSVIRANPSGFAPAAAFRPSEMCP